jgi:hypothetical protein
VHGTSKDEALLAQTNSAAAYLPLFLFPLAAALVRNRMPPWVFMWLMAFALFAGCKWLTWWKSRLIASSPWRSLAYLLLWPGMDAVHFLDAQRVPPKPAAMEWFAAGLKTAVGIVLIWMFAHRFTSPMLQGWVGMLGLVFLLHFGSFHLLALAWQAIGVDAEPIMRFPLGSRSLSEFWGKRWNMGFRQLTFELVFQPLRRSAGIAAATFASFVVSGLIHELVISFPARAGYGLPTAYFALQGAGVLAERSALGKRLGLTGGVRGWLSAVGVAAGPAYFLFHPWFVLRVVVPFLRAIGA